MAEASPYPFPGVWRRPEPYPEDEAWPKTHPLDRASPTGFQEIGGRPSRDLRMGAAPQLMASPPGNLS